jgi:hypothetical protein
MVMDVDFESAVENMTVAHSNAIKTVLEAVANSIQSCRHDENSHSITVKLLSYNTTIDGKESTIIDGFQITDDGEGFTEENYSSFKTIGSRLKKLEFGCKGVGRLTWLKVFSKVKVESTYTVNKESFHREFTFTLKDKGVKGGDTPVKFEKECTPKTVITVEGCISEYKEDIQTTVKSLTSKIADHCISFYLDKKKDVPTIVVTHGEEREIVNQIWESTISTTDQIKFSVKGFDFDLTHVKFYKNYGLDNGISLCADGLEVQPIKKFDYDLEDEEQRKFRYRCFISGDLLNSTVNQTRDGFSIGMSSRTLEHYDKPSIDEIVDGVIPICEDYLKVYSDSHKERCMNRLKKFIDTDVGKSFSSVLKYDPEVMAAVKPDMKDSELHKLMSDRMQKLESELLFTPTLGKNPKTDTSEAVERRMNLIKDVQKDELTKMFVHRGLILSAFDDRLEALNRMHPEKNDEYKMELESVIHDLILPRGTDAKNQPTLSSCNLWILDERLNTYAFQGAYSDLQIRSISDSDSEDRPDVFIFGNIRDNMVAESICIIEFKRPNRGDKKIISQINRYIDEFIDNGVYNYRREKVTIDPNTTTFFCYAVCDTNSDDFKKELRHLDMNEKFGGRGYYSWNGQTRTAYDVIDHHQVFADAKCRYKVFFSLIGLEVGSDYVIVTKGETGEKTKIDLNNKMLSKIE